MRGNSVFVLEDVGQFVQTLWMVRRRSEAHSHAAKEFTALVAEATSKTLMTEGPRNFKRVGARQA